MSCGISSEKIRPQTAQQIIDLITSQIDAQCAKGLEKYGTTIDDASDSGYDWKQMAIEELIDCCQYLAREVGKANRDR